MKVLFTTKIASIMFGIGFIYFVSSCDKQESLVTPAPVAGESKKITIGKVVVEEKDGRLVFNDRKEFENAIKYFQKMTKIERETMMANDGFTSFSENLVLLEKNAGAKEDLPQEQIKSGKLPDFKSDVLSMFLNGSGVIQIGDEIFKVGTNKVYQMKKGQEAFLSLPTLEGNSAVVVHDIIKTSKVAKVASTDNYIDFDSDHRAITSFWANSYWFYSEAGVSTTFQTYRQHSFLWWSWGSWDNSNDSENVGLTIEYARIYYWISGDENWFTRTNESYSDQSSCSVTLGWVIFGIVNVPEAHINHTARYNGTTKSYHYDR